MMRFEHSHENCGPQGLVAEVADILLSYVRIKPKNKCLQAHEVHFLIDLNLFLNRKLTILGCFD